MFSVAPLLRITNILSNHFEDFFGSMLLGEHVLPHCNGRKFWQMLVFGNCQNFLLSQITKTDAVLQCNHGARPSSIHRCPQLFYHFGATDILRDCVFASTIFGNFRWRTPFSIEASIFS